MKHLLASMVLAAAAFSATALPTVDAVQAEVQRGNYAAAESMMLEVVTAKPSSARAHYIYAEVLAHNRHLDQAERELQTARKLDPEARFTQTDKLKAFEQARERARQQAPSPRAAAPLALPARVAEASSVERGAPASGGGVPGWLWGALGAVAAVGVWRMLGASRARSPGNGAMAMPAAAPYGAAGTGAMAGAPYGVGPGMAPQGAGGGMLRTGLAAAGGFAAGMLAEKMFEGHHETTDLPRHDTPAGSSGLVPGMFDDAGSAQADLDRTPIDFGSGDGWGGGGGDDASGGDGGW